MSSLLTGWLGERFARRIALKPAAFVTGMPKSGTTAIVRLMGHSAGLSAVNDPFHALDRRGLQFRDELFGGHLSCSDLMKQHPKVFQGALVKDPNLIFFFNDIRTAYPDAAWVFTIRDPRDNIRSILNRLGLPGCSDLLNDRIGSVGESWRRVLEGWTPAIAGETVIERLATRWMVVATAFLESRDSMHLSRYEDFLRDKEAAIQNLCRAVGLNPKHSIRQTADKPFQPPGDRDVTWQRFFAPHDMAAIDRICGDLLPVFGYGTTRAA